MLEAAAKRGATIPKDARRFAIGKAERTANNIANGERPSSQLASRLRRVSDLFQNPQAGCQPTVGGGSISSKPACADRPHYHSGIFFRRGGFLSGLFDWALSNVFESPKK